MKKNLILSIGILVIAFGGAVYAKKAEKLHECTKFIKAGASARGNGSKEKPFNSFAAAEAAQWETLVVLSSSQVLVGNLTLKDGQDVKGSDSKELPVVSSTEGFAVITCNGENKVSKLHFKDVWAVAIDLTTGTDVCFEDLLITGHNQSQSLYEDWISGGDIDVTEGIGWAVAAISGFPEMSETPKAGGDVNINKVTVENGRGFGVFIATRSTWQAPNPTRVQRDVTVTCSNFRDLTAVDRGDQLITAITAITGGDNARATLKADHCLIDGIFGPRPTGIFTHTSSPGIYQSFPLTQIEHCKIFNVIGDGLGWSFVMDNDNNGATERLDINIRHNETAHTLDGFLLRQGLPSNEPGPGPGPMFIDFSNNKIKDIILFDAIFYLPLEDSYAFLNIENNEFEDIGCHVVAFFNVTSTGNSTFGPSVDSNIKGNTAKGFGEGIGIWNIRDLPFNQLSVLAEKNCYENGVFGIFDFNNVEDPIPPLNQLLDAGCGPLNSLGKNSWVNMEIDAFLQASSIYAIKNWWGTTAGPQNVIKEGGEFFFIPILTKDPCKKKCETSHKLEAKKALAQENDNGPVGHIEEMMKKKLKAIERFSNA